MGDLITYILNNITEIDFALGWCLNEFFVKSANNLYLYIAFFITIPSYFLALIIIVSLCLIFKIFITYKEKKTAIAN